tara:strand:+ start:94 stop:729 length:636 start_codon:yes stop_codon:yes gene_type:complete
MTIEEKLTPGNALIGGASRNLRELVIDALKPFTFHIFGPLSDQSEKDDEDLVDFTNCFFRMSDIRNVRDLIINWDELSSVVPFTPLNVMMYEALLPFAKISEHELYDDSGDGEDDWVPYEGVSVTMGAFRKAQHLTRNWCELDVSVESPIADGIADAIVKAREVASHSVIDDMTQEEFDALNCANERAILSDDEGPDLDLDKGILDIASSR